MSFLSFLFKFKINLTQLHILNLKEPSFLYKILYPDSIHKYFYSKLYKNYKFNFFFFFSFLNPKFKLSKMVLKDSIVKV